MGRLQARFAATLLILFALIVAGCGDTTGPAPPSGGGRDYGPPFEEIVFIDEDGYLATVEPVAGGDPYYVPGIGSANEFQDIDHGFFVRPNSTPEVAYFAVYDLSSGRLEVIDSNGNPAGSNFDGSEAYENLFTFSTAGARIVYVRESDGAQQLMIEGVTTVDLNVVTTLGANDSFAGRLTAYITGFTTRICAVVQGEGRSLRLRVWDRDGTIRAERSVTARSPVYSHDGSRIAYIEAPPGNNQGTEVVILNSSLNELARFPFSDYGTGATALSWSPDDTRIAFFAGASQVMGTLVYIDLGQEIIREVPFDETIVFPSAPDELLWAQPNWSPGGNELVFTIRTDEGGDAARYDVIRTDLNGQVTTLYEGVGGPKFVVWMD